MAQPKATYEAVAAAIEQLKAEGRNVIIASIQAITGGSNGTIIKHREAYDRAHPAIEAAKAVAVSPAVIDAIARDTAEKVGAATQEAIAARDQFKIELLMAGADLEAAQADLEASITENDKMRDQVQTLNGQIDQLKADADAIKNEAAGQIRAAEERAAQAVTKAETEATKESKDREAAQMALAKAELRLEALPRLEKEIERLQTALDTERNARTAAEQAAAVANTKAEGLAARLADAQEQHKASQASIEARLADAQEQAKEQKQRAGETILKIESKLAGTENELAELRKGKK